MGLLFAVFFLQLFFLFERILSLFCKLGICFLLLLLDISYTIDAYMYIHAGRYIKLGCYHQKKEKSCHFKGKELNANNSSLLINESIYMILFIIPSS